LVPPELPDDVPELPDDVAAELPDDVVAELPDTVVEVLLADFDELLHPAVTIAAAAAATVRSLFFLLTTCFNSLPLLLCDGDASPSTATRSAL
jgi:hypothetical protein